jgi:hypothetical protein
MSEHQTEDIEILINRLIDNRLDPDQQAALEKQLLRDPEAHAMLRASQSLDDECRDAIEASLTTKTRAETDPPAGRAWPLAIIAAAAAVIVIGIAVWAAITPDPGASSGPIAGGEIQPGPTTMQSAELAVDRFDPTPVRHMMTNPVRRVDRIPVGLYDAESGQMRIILVDREQEQPEPQWLDL